MKEPDTIIDINFAENIISKGNTVRGIGLFFIESWDKELLLSGERNHTKRFSHRLYSCHLHDSSHHAAMLLQS